MNYITDPHAAELNAAAQMREWGFVDAVATTGGPDGGIDVTSRDALAQVKWEGGVVGSAYLQKLYGARGTGRQALYFFSAAGYSKPALKVAKQLSINLCQYDPTGNVTFIYRVGAPQPVSRAIVRKDDLRWFGILVVALIMAVILMVLVSSHV